MALFRILVASALMAIAARATVAASGPLPEPVVLRNSDGMEVHILPVGASLQRLLVPDAAGQLADVLLGFDSEENGSNPQMGSTLGRVGGRIAGAQFTLDGITYHLDANAGNNTLHSGAQGWDKQTFAVEEVGPAGSSPSWVRLAYHSSDGEGGFPGSVNVSVTYALHEDNVLSMEVTAESDAPTPVSSYGHPYFNLGGHASGSVLGHILTINASQYLPFAGDTLIPAGTILPVEGTIYDFRQGRALGDNIDTLLNTTLGGWDNTWALFGLDQDAAEEVQDFEAVPTPEWAATLVDPASGRGVHIFTTAPGMVVYTGNWLDGSVPGKGGVLYAPHDGVAIECGQFPNAVNTPAFPSVVLRPGSVYRNRVEWRFSAEEAAETAR
ncbi:hypothetical protein ABPG75_010928 [Micractinium tetrahymenae]